MYCAPVATVAGGGLYVAFNTSHVTKVVELPNWQGRAWKLMVDTGKLTPFDILIADEDLALEEAHQVCLRFCCAWGF